MAKITVTEKDLSWYYRQRQRGNLVVYTPGLASFGPAVPTYVTEDTFGRIFGGPIDVKGDYSYYIAESLLKSGVDVLFHRILPDGAEKAVCAMTGYIVTTVDSTNQTPGSDPITITINGTNYQFTAGEVATVNIPASSEDTQTEIETQLQALVTAETIESFTTSADTGEILAKYSGEFGNTLYLTAKAPTVQEDGSALRYFYVYAGASQSTSVLVEQLIVEFKNPMSQYYYENVDSNYIEFVIDGEFDDSWFTSMTKSGFSGGKNYGDAVDPVESVIATLKDADFLNDLKDPYGYYYDVLINGALYNDTQSDMLAVDKNFANVAQANGMAVYLIGGSSDMDSGTFMTYCGDFNSSFTSAIGPWTFAQFVSNGYYAWLPGYYAFLVAWGNSIASGNPVWYAPAGTQRARVGTVVKKLKYPVGSTVLDQWQNQDFVTSNEGGYKLNPIMNVKQYGYCIYGNSTLLKGKPDGSTSMLQSLGTRVLVNQIKAKAFEVALGLQFDQLSDNLFMAFKVQLGAYMDQLKYQGGLYDYQIILDRNSVTFADLNQRTVPVKIKISPNPAAEVFDIVCEVYPSGITFTDEFDEFSVNA